jgi:putative endopeptidase
MDEAGVESKGFKVMEPAFKRIDDIFSRNELAAALGETLRADVDILNNTSLHTPHLFGLWVAQDLNDPKRYLPFLLQGGLGMPDREYYLGTSSAMAAIRPQYQAHIAAVLQAAGIDASQARAEKIFELERRMAEVHWTRVASEKIEAGNNHWSRAQFYAEAPDLDWRAFFSAAGLGGQNEFVVWQPSALIGLSKLIASESLDTWKDYLKFHALEDAAPYLPKKFVDENFAFYERVLKGTPELSPRWKRAVATCNAYLGDAVGKLYVGKYFSPEQKKRAAAMVQNLLAAFETRIDRLDWMAPQTKLVAKAKLKALKIGVGYPDHWRSYADLKITRGDTFGNWSRADLYAYRRQLAKLGEPVDRSEWVMNAQLVNAVNLPAMNAINFPAAILQPPYFDSRTSRWSWTMARSAPPSVMRSATASMIRARSSMPRAACGTGGSRTISRISAHRVPASRRSSMATNRLRTWHVNGEQTLSENIADVAGLNAAYDAYRLAIAPGRHPRLERARDSMPISCSF